MDEERKYDPVTPAAKEDIRPNFLGGQGGGEAIAGTEDDNEKGGLYDSSKKEKNNEAANDLKSAEDAAADADMSQAEDSLDGARTNERAANGLYSKASLNNSKKGKGKGSFKGKLLKRGGPIGGIIFIVFIVGAIFAGTQSSQLFSWVANIQDSFNSMHSSAFSRTSRIIRYQMNSNRNNPVKGSLFGKDKFVLSKKQIANYEKHGITYNDEYVDPDGNKIRVLEYETDGGQKRIVTADADTAAALRSAGRPALSIDAAYQDTSFNQKYTAASKSWQGQFANWFGTNTNNFLKNNKLTRNMWKNYKKDAESADASGKSRLSVVKDTISNRISDGESGGFNRRVNVTDDEGNTTQVDRTENNSKITADNIGSKLDAIKGTISTGINLGCAIADFIGVVSLIVTAQQALQIVNLTTAYMETVDKTKAGYGEEAPINEIGNSLNEKVAVDHSVIVSGTGETISYDGTSMTTEAKTDTVKSDAKSAMQSAGMAALFGNGLTDPTDPSVQSFNMTSQLNTLLGGVGLSIDSFMACTAGKVTAALLNIGADVVLCVITACIGTLLKDVAVGTAVGLAITGLIAILTPWLVSILERDIVSTLAGEDLGNALVSGANMYNGYVHKTNGGSLSTEEKYKQFAVVQQQVIAEDARMERETLSPFDITSKNTFMGSIMSRLSNFMSTDSVMSTMSTGGSVLSSSLLALTPSTSAVASQIAESLPTMEEYEKICPYLASIGAIGDSFCNPYMVTDYDTMDVDPADVINTISDQFEDTETSDGNVKIKKDSDLMKYITYCGERTSAFGVVDQTIASDFKASTGIPVLDAILGAAPIIGDLIDIYDSDVTSRNIGYIDGESCVAGNDLYLDTGATSSPKWDTAKYYQRFIEDQSLFESMGIIEESAVSVALNEYYEENPLDDSYEGMLARYSGLSKETVSDVLDIVSYLESTGNYDPSDKYVFGEPAVDDNNEDDEPLMLGHENVMGGEVTALEEIVYADLRNRNFAV